MLSSPVYKYARPLFGVDFDVFSTFSLPPKEYVNQEIPPNGISCIDDGKVKSSIASIYHLLLRKAMAPHVALIESSQS